MPLTSKSTIAPKTKSAASERKPARPVRRAKKRRTLRPAVGDLVLVGGPGTTRPSDWFIATVLWTDGEEMLTEHEPPSTRRLQRQVLDVDHVRGIGTARELSRWRERCRKELAREDERIRKAGDLLAQARGRLWTRLDLIAAKPLGDAIRVAP